MFSANIGTLTNLQAQANLQKYIAMTLLIIVLGWTLVQSGIVVHLYLDNSKKNAALFSWKVVNNLYNVLNSFLVMIVWKYSIGQQMDLAKTRFSFSARCNLSR